MKQPKNPQDDDVETTSECPDERRPVTEQIEDTAKVKITKEKSEPRDQANRNSPDSRSLRSGSWACQSPVLAQMQDPTDASVLKSVEIHQVQQRQVPTAWVPHVLHRDKFVNQRIVTYRLKPSRKQRKHHICDRVDAGANDAKVTDNCGSAQGTDFQTQALTIRKRRRRCSEHPDCRKSWRFHRYKSSLRLPRSRGVGGDRF